MTLLPATADSPGPSALLRHRGAILARELRDWLTRRRSLLLLLLAVGLCASIEMKFSWIGSRLFSALASSCTYSLAPGPSASIRYPDPGPSDLRRGYSALPEFARHLAHQGFTIDEQARNSTSSLLFARLGLYPIYHEKSNAGIDILDRTGDPIYSFRDPHRTYPDFDSIPPIVVRTLLFIENRHLLDESEPNENPAIEWQRMGRAAFDYSLHQFDRRHPRSGGSTLATQLEKFRHSPEGRTHSPTEKLRQIASATLRSYQDGPRTLNTQREVICEYINSMPLAATPGIGEVSGLGDGLAAWYGSDFGEVNRLLNSNPDSLTLQERNNLGRAYRQVLSLFIALRRPSMYLAQNADALASETNRYLNALGNAGVISPLLHDAALRNRSEFRSAVSRPAAADFVEGKAANAVRIQLLQFLDVENTYSLDRLDLSAETAIDQKLQKSVTQFLQRIADPENARLAGLDSDRMLSAGDSRQVIYSFTLYERVNGVNLLRAQTDTFNQPLSIIEGTRLQLGSTAKLRTLIHYLQIIEELHGRLSKLTPLELNESTVPPGDRLTAWAVEYLSAENDRSLQAMLGAALDRKYSGSAGEAFFTAGGLHVFGNFERQENSRFFTVREAFEQSVNLVFIRLMRDIENYYKWRVPGASPDTLADPNNPARERYLRRFADEEGSLFLARFYEKYHGLTPDQALERVIRDIHPTATRVAVIFRSARPSADLATFSRFLKDHLPEAAWARCNPQKLYAAFAPGAFNLSDRGYLARIHPLELWLLAYLEQHPQATLSQALAASAAERQDSYRWLFRPKLRRGQDLRIGILLEKDAFHEIWKAWKRLGYPFDTLTPSYATAIGVSGDTPAALAELAGIIAGNGIRYPVETVGRLRFARGTPIETSFAFHPPAGEQVLSPIIARLVHDQMLGVVKNGTGRRALNAFALPGGRAIAVAGKTGTGDNRFKIWAKANTLIDDRPVNRTAAFVFIIGDRFFGTVMAFVPGKNAASYKFTSSLAVQVFKDLAPKLQPLMSGSPPSEVQLARVDSR
jgi:membrane peptidoglycan carboxypeptidase